MDESDQQALLAFARRSLQSFLEHQHLPVFPLSDYPALGVRAGVFISIYVEGKLRGCVGHIDQDLPLYQAVQEMTIAAASRDLRFVSIHVKDLPHVSLEISLLSPFTLIHHYNSIKIGQHGVMIQSGTKQGLLLPQVAESRNWTPQKFLAECCRKANLPRKAYTREDTQISIFEAQVIREIAGNNV